MSNKNREFVGIITDTDEVVMKEDLYSRYALKDDNRDTSPTNLMKVDKFKGIDNLKKPLYNPESLAGLLEINTFHNRCTRTKAQDIAGTGFYFNPIVDNPNNEEFEKLDNLFNGQFPPVGTQLVQAVIDYESIGYCFLELVPEGNRHDTIYKYINHAPAHTVRVHETSLKYCQMRGVKKVWFKHPELEMDVDKETGTEHPLGSLSPEKRANDMIMIYNYTPRSDYYGVPDVIDALGAIQGNLAQRNYNNKFFENHGVPNYAIYITGDYDLEMDENGNYKVVEQIKKYMNAVRKNPHSSLVFGIPSAGIDGQDVKVHFEELAINEKDASFRMYRKDNRDEIVISHAVPPYRIGLAEIGSLGGNTAKESNEIYKESVVGPRQREIESYINKYVLRDNMEIETYEFRLNPLEIDSEENDRKNLEFLFKNGGASPNDLIKSLGKQYGIEPFEDEPAMNAHYVNGQPITNVKEINEQNGNTGNGNTGYATFSKKNSVGSIEELFRAMKDRLSRGDE